MKKEHGRVRWLKNMAKVLVDTNVILRYILNDNEDMAMEAANIIKNGAITLPEVLAEVVYVLKKSIRSTKKIL